MYFRKCFRILVILVLSVSTPLRAEHDSFSSHLSNENLLVRSLRAASPKAGIRSRAIGGCLRPDLDLHYVDGIIALKESLSLGTPSNVLS
jgi:hypothetical protein